MVACAAVYPEIKAPVRAPPSGRELEPPPPKDLVFIAFERAEIPERTRDGRKWDTIAGDAPDPFGKVLVDDVEVIRTPLASNTLRPTWPEQKLANYRVPASARVRIELWDSNPISNHPICVKEMSDFLSQVSREPLQISCESDARIVLRAEPAHARWGLGFFYEVRTGGAAVTRVLSESPAARAGLTAGDDILSVGGKKVSEMDEDQLQSRINMQGQTGLLLEVEGKDGKRRTVSLKEGVIYPVSDEGIPIQ